MQNNTPNGLLSSSAVNATGSIDSNFFIRKQDPVIINTLIANEIITEEIVLDEDVLTAVDGFLFINGDPVGGTLNSLTAIPPLLIQGGAINEIISIQPSGVNPGTYTLANVSVNSQGLITSATDGVIPPNDDWANFPALTNVNMNSRRIVNMVAPINIGDATNKSYVDTLDNENIKLFGNQSIAGIKSFQSGPICNILPDAGFRLANRTYVDGLDVNNLKLTGAQQTVSSVKSFTALPITSVAPTIPTHFTNKAYVDSVSSAPTLASVLTAGNTCNQDINFNGFDIDAVNDIRFSGLLPTISSSSLISNLLITSSASMTLATIGLLSLASGGILSLGGGVYTTLENLRIDNSSISKEPNTANLSFNNVEIINGNTLQQNINFNENGNLSLHNSATNGDILLEAHTVSVQNFIFGDKIDNNRVTSNRDNDNVLISPSLISLENETVQKSIILNLIDGNIEVNDALEKTVIIGNQIKFTDAVTGYSATHNTVSSTIADPMGTAELLSDRLAFRVAGSTAIRSSISPDYLLLRETIINLGTISTSITVTNTGGASFNWFTVEMTGSGSVTALNTPGFRNNGVYRIRFNGRTGAVLNAVLSNNAGFTNRTQNTANIGVGANVIALMTIIVSGTTNLISTQVFT